MKVFKLIACLFGLHDWTNAALEGKKPTEEQLKSFAGFKDYSKMYCKHCKKESKLNNKI